MQRLQIAGTFKGMAKGWEGQGGCGGLGWAWKAERGTENCGAKVIQGCDTWARQDRDFTHCTREMNCTERRQNRHIKAVCAPAHTDIPRVSFARRGSDRTQRTIWNRLLNCKGFWPTLAHANVDCVAGCAHVAQERTQEANRCLPQHLVHNRLGGSAPHILFFGQYKHLHALQSPAPQVGLQLDTEKGDMGGMCRGAGSTPKMEVTCASIQGSAEA